MTTTIEKEFRSLTIAERVDLVEELWEQIAYEPESVPVPEWQIKELELDVFFIKRTPSVRFHGHRPKLKS